MTLYLILHKVRGEAAFDVAQKIDDEIWIIPTSGHRAYPIFTQALDRMVYVDKLITNAPHDNDWAALPDHYNTEADKTSRLDELKQILGLGKKPKPPIERRF